MKQCSYAVRELKATTHKHTHRTKALRHYMTIFHTSCFFASNTHSSSVDPIKTHAVTSHQHSNTVVNTFMRQADASLTASLRHPHDYSASFSKHSPYAKREDIRILKLSFPASPRLKLAFGVVFQQLFSYSLSTF